MSKEGSKNDRKEQTSLVQEVQRSAGQFGHHVSGDQIGKLRFRDKLCHRLAQPKFSVFATIRESFMNGTAIPTCLVQLIMSYLSDPLYPVFKSLRDNSTAARILETLRQATPPHLKIIPGTIENQIRLLRKLGDHLDSNYANECNLEIRLCEWIQQLHDRWKYGTCIYRVLYDGYFFDAYGARNVLVNRQGSSSSTFIPQANVNLYRWKVDSKCLNRPDKEKGKTCRTIAARGKVSKPIHKTFWDILDLCPEWLATVRLNPGTGFQVTPKTSKTVWIDFDGQNCGMYNPRGEACKGWDGVSRRCQCGNRRVSWNQYGRAEAW